MENYLATGVIQNRKNQLKIAAVITTTKKSKPRWARLKFQFRVNRTGEFEPILIPKYKRDVSNIDSKVLAMYAR